MLLFACSAASLPPTDAPPLFEFSNPEITSLSMECNASDEQWVFTMEANAWTGNGQIWISKAGEINEKHRIYSKQALADGRYDLLELKLDILADWRDVQEGTSTQWHCYEQDEMTFLAVVLHPESLQATDCRYWGAQEWEDIMDSPPCEQPADM